MRTRFLFHFIIVIIIIFFTEWKKKICLLLFPCTQLPVPLGHAGDLGLRGGEEDEEEDRLVGKKDKLLDKQT